MVRIVMILMMLRRLLGPDLVYCDFEVRETAAGLPSVLGHGMIGAKNPIPEHR